MRDKGTRGSSVIPARRDAIALVLIFVISAAVISPSLGGGFTNWDDDRFVVDNERVSNLDAENIAWAFGGIRFELYQPLFLVSLMVDGELWGGSPLGYRLHNLILYLLGIAGVFALLRRLGMGTIPAAAGVLFFAIAPSRVESVAWISSRKDVLMLALSMLVWHLHLSASKTSRRKIGFRVLATLAFLAALLAKSGAVVLPFMMAAVDLTIRRRGPVKTVMRALPFAIPAAAVAIWAPLLWREAQLLTDPVSEGIAGRFTLVGWTFTHYLKTTLWPFHLSPLYAQPHESDLLPGSICALALILVAVTAIALARKMGKGTRTFTAALAIWIFGLAPYLNIIPIYYVVSDRYLLLPSLAIAIMGARIAVIALGLESPYRTMLFAGLTAIAISWGISAGMESRAWRDSRSLWAHATEREPGCFHARLKMGETLRDEGEPEASAQQYEEARKIRPGSPTALAGVFWSRLLTDAKETPLSPGEDERIVAAFVGVMNDGREMMPFAARLKREGYPRAAQIVASRYREWLAPEKK